MGKRVKDGKARKPIKRSMRGSWHDGIFEAGCPVCTHARKATIEALYLKGSRMAELAALTQIAEQALRDHLDGVGLIDQRANSTDLFYARIIDMGFEHIRPEDITVEMLQKALNWKDKLNGRIVDKIEQLRPSKIIILSPTQTGDLVEDARSDVQKASLGEVVRALGPGET